MKVDLISTGEYNGTSWPSACYLNVGREWLAAAGTKYVKLAFGGTYSGQLASTEESNRSLISVTCDLF